MRRVGSYEILRELGRGANGVVYLARHGPSGQPVAIKVLLHADAADEEELARFELEAKIANKLRHPGIVGVLDFGAQSGRPYCVMEFCEGTSLSTLLEAGPLSPQDSVEILSEVAQAMAYAHHAGVIHRDLKPANIIITPNGRPRVTDFGLARDRSLLRSLTRTGDVLGTPVTMAPEQFRGTRAIDHRVDVYALGATLYRCMTGHYPHRARQVVELMDQVCNHTPAAPSSLVPGISRSLDAVCMRALAKDPDERYPDCLALAEAMTGAELKAPSQPRNPAGRLQAALMGGLIGLILVVLPLALWLRSRSDTAELDARISEAAALGTSVEEFRRAFDLLSSAETAAAGHSPQLQAIHAERKRRAQTILNRVQTLRSWAERTELLELVPELDPSLADDALTESYHQAGSLLQVLEDDTQGDVPGGFALLRRLAKGHAELLAEAAHLEAEHDWERSLASAQRAGVSDSFGAAQARLLALRADAEREGASDRVDRVDLGLGKLAVRRGRIDTARDCLTQLAARSPTLKVEALLYRTIAEWTLSTWSDAHWEPFARIAKIEPHTVVGLTASAMSLLGGRYRGGRISDAELNERGMRALKSALAALELDPHYGPALVAKAVAQTQTGDPRTATETLLQAAAVAPDDSCVFLVMCSVLRRARRRGLPDDLVETLLLGRDRYLELTAGGSQRRTRTRILVSRASALLDAGHYADALRDYDDALHIRPFDSSAQFHRGLAVAMLEGPAAATENWQLAQALRPDMGRRSRTFEDLLDSAPAACAQLRPRILSAVDLLAPIEDRAQGAPEGAREELTMALRLAIQGGPWADVRDAVAAAQRAAPESPFVALEAARILCGRDLLPEAQAAITAARGLTPEPAFELDRLEAELHLRRGQLQAARAAYRKLSERDPEGVEGRCASAELALLAHDGERAVELAQAALDLAPDHVPSLVVQSLALVSSDPSRACYLAGRARCLERELNSRATLALLVANFEGIAKGDRAWIPAPRIEELARTSRGVTWRIVTARYISLYRIGDPAEFLPSPAELDTGRADIHELRGTLLLTRKSTRAEEVLQHWRKARSLDPEFQFDPTTVSLFEERFPGVFAAQFGER